MSEATPPVQGLVPHRGAARFVERIVAWNADSIECVGQIPLENVCVKEGFAPALVGLELAAQAAAALEALSRRGSGQSWPPLVGYLVSVKEAAFSVSRLCAGVDLTARVARIGKASALATYEVRILHAGLECVFAILSTYAAQTRDSNRQKEP